MLNLGPKINDESGDFIKYNAWKSWSTNLEKKLRIVDFGPKKDPFTPFWS